MNFYSHWVPALRAIFTYKSIIKVGAQVCPALLAIDLAETVRSVSNPQFIDLGYYAKLVGVLENPGSSLDTLAGVILKKSRKSPSHCFHPIHILGLSVLLLSQPLILFIQRLIISGKFGQPCLSRSLLG